MSCGQVSIFLSKTKGIKCSVPSVPAFSTSIQQFNQQILRNTLLKLKCCQVLNLQERQPILGQIQTFFDEIFQNQLLNSSIELSIPAININSTNITLEDVQFRILGFSSAIIGISGKVAVEVDFDGADGVKRNEKRYISFSFQETIPGDFPRNIRVDGSLWLSNTRVETDIDPSNLTVSGISVNLFFAHKIRLFVP